MPIGKDCQEPTRAKEEHHPHFSDQRNDIASSPVSEEAWYSCRLLVTWRSAQLRNHWEREVPGVRAGVCGVRGTVTCGLFENDKECMSGGIDSHPHFSSLLGASSSSFATIKTSSFLLASLHCPPAFLPLPGLLCSRSVVLTH